MISMLLLGKGEFVNEKFRDGSPVYHCAILSRARAPNTFCDVIDFRFPYTATYNCYVEVFVDGKYYT